MVMDILINSALYIFVVIIPLGILVLVLRAVFGYFSRRKRQKRVQERLREARE